MTSYDQLAANTEAVLRSICGTAHNGKANTCDHDHSAQASGLVRQISTYAQQDLAHGFDYEGSTANSVIWEAAGLGKPG